MRQLIVIAPVVAALGLVGCQQRAAQEGREAGSAGSGSAIAAAAGSGSAAVGAGSAAGSGSAAVNDPWAAVAKPKPPDTPEARKARTDAAIARVTSIEPEVAKLRQLSFLKPVPAHYQPTAEFQAHVHSEIAKELPAARSRAQSATLYHLGFFDKQVDLANVIENAMVTQAGAYYDPARKEFYLVVAPDDLLLDTISAHELTHALQDQHFGLDKYLPDYHRIDDDAAIARRFVVEGDATFVMLLYAVRSVLGNGEPPPAMMANIKAQIERYANQSLDELKAQVKAQSALLGASLGGDIQKSIDSMDDIPAVVAAPLFDSYMKGALVALTAYEHGGWAAVDDLFRHPPESSEQVMHPATKLFPTRDHPRHVSLGDGDKDSNVIGELQWLVYFELWKVAHADDAAAGWGGDRYAVTTRKDGRLVGRIATVWDSEADAEQFYAAYVASLPVRFHGADISHPEAGVPRSDAGKIFVQRTGAQVFIVDGGDDPRELAELIKHAKIN